MEMLCEVWEENPHVVLYPCIHLAYDVIPWHLTALALVIQSQCKRSHHMQSSCKLVLCESACASLCTKLTVKMYWLALLPITASSHGDIALGVLHFCT